MKLPKINTISIWRSSILFTCVFVLFTLTSSASAATTIFSDNFNSSYATLASHVPSTIGTSWTLLVNNGVALFVQSYNNNVNVQANTANGGSIYTANGTYPHADYEVSADAVYAAGNTDYSRSLILRATDANNMYLLRVTNATMTIYKRVSGTWTSLGSGSGVGLVDNTVSPYKIATLKFSATGTTLTGSVDGVTKVTLTDSSITATGKAGIGLGYTVISTDDGGTGVQMDNVVVQTTADDTTAPTITNVTSDKASGTYTTGEVIDIDVTFSEAITSTGNVTITLETGATDRTCTFTVSSATTGTCNYTVQSGDTSADLTVNSISGTIADAASNAMTNFVPATNLAANKALVIDSIVPTVSVTAPTSGETVSGSSVTLTASASDVDSSVSGVKFYINGTLQGSEDTSSPFTMSWNSMATTSQAYNIVAVARDAATNYATSTAVSFIVLNTGPTPTAVTVVPTTSSATITWTTSVFASSRIFFGPSIASSSSTPETNTSLEVTNPSIGLTGLPACSLYYYEVVSKNSVYDTATSSVSSFTTAGCTGGAAVLATGTENITTTSGGTLTQGALKLTIPASFTGSSSSAVFQAKLLDPTTFFASAGAPSGKTRAGNTVFNLKALTDTTTTLTTFSAALTITLAYEASDISGLNESALLIYRYDGSGWSPLSGCSTNTSAKTITCTTTAFSDFAIFGTTASSSGGSFFSVQPTAIQKIGDVGHIPLSFIINRGESTAVDPILKLTLNGSPETVINYAVSLDSTFTNASLLPYATTTFFTLPNKPGSYILYLRYFSTTGHPSMVLSTIIRLEPAEKEVVPILVAPPSSKEVEPISAAPPSSLVPISAAPPSSFIFKRTLKKGSRGDDVKYLQTFLNTRGFPLAKNGAGSPGNETIYFAQRTKNALAKFQEANAKYILTPFNLTKGTGILGEHDNKFLNALIAK